MLSVHGVCPFVRIRANQNIYVFAYEIFIWLRLVPTRSGEDSTYTGGTSINGACVNELLLIGWQRVFFRMRLSVKGPTRICGPLDCIDSENTFLLLVVSLGNVVF